MLSASMPPVDQLVLVMRVSAMCMLLSSVQRWEGLSVRAAAGLVSRDVAAASSCGVVAVARVVAWAFRMAGRLLVVWWAAGAAAGWVPA